MSRAPGSSFEQLDKDIAELKDNCRRNGTLFDPRKVWSLYLDEAPVIAHAAIALLSVAGSEAAVERSFSAQGTVHSDRRNRMTDKMVEAEMYIRFNRLALRRASGEVKSSSEKTAEIVDDDEENDDDDAASSVADLFKRIAVPVLLPEQDEKQPQQQPQQPQQQDEQPPQPAVVPQSASSTSVRQRHRTIYQRVCAHTQHHRSVQMARSPRTAVASSGSQLRSANAGHSDGAEEEDDGVRQRVGCRGGSSGSRGCDERQIIHTVRDILCSVDFPVESGRVDASTPPQSGRGIDPQKSTTLRDHGVVAVELLQLPGKYLYKQRISTHAHRMLNRQQQRGNEWQLQRLRSKLLGDRAMAVPAPARGPAAPAAASAVVAPHDNAVPDDEDDDSKYYDSSDDMDALAVDKRLHRG